MKPMSNIVYQIQYLLIYLYFATYRNLAAYEACKFYEGWKNAKGEAYADRWAGDLFLMPKRLKGLLQTAAGYFRLVAKPGCWDIGFRQISLNI